MMATLVSISDTHGGAPRATVRLHMALRGHGVDSQLVVRSRRSDAPNVRGYPLRWRRWSRRGGSWANRAVVRLQRTDNPVLHSANIAPTRWAHHLAGDVVNLHWIGGGTMSIEDVGRIGPPVVLTLHDMWAFCGAEHYAPDTPAARWVVGYSRDNRPEGHGGLDVDRLTWLRKRRAWRPMTVVTPSRWLAGCAARSALMADWWVHTVPNALDLTVFRPGSRDEARAALGLPRDVHLVLFGAIGGSSDPRKGFDLLVDALCKLEADDVVGVVVGQDEPTGDPSAGIPLHWTGHVDTDERMAQLYRAADVVVVPSRQENLPQTATEAQACGIPVVAFDTTGLPDAVKDRTTGYLAEPFDPDALAAGIDWVLEDADRRARLGQAARRRAERLWAPEIVARQYRQIYHDALARHRGSPLGSG